MHRAKIDQHGVIGNMRTAALVDTAGTIDFLCFPEFDSPAVFAGLLDGDQGGFFSVEPEMTDLRTRQMYLPDTNLLLTRFLSEEGVAELTDFMPLTDGERLGPYSNQILRLVHVIHGTVRFRAKCAPRFDFARVPHQACQQGGGVCFHPDGPAAGIPDGSPQGEQDTRALRSVALYSTIPLQTDGQDAFAEFTLEAGQSAAFAFGSVAKEEVEPSKLLSEERIGAEFERTVHFWRQWISQSKYTGHWREIVNRSALVLKLLTSDKYGSVAAAATTGLPERLGGSRNWDYRYSWLRDSAFAMYAFMRLGFTAEAYQFTGWMKDRLTAGLEHMVEDGPLRIMYRMDGGPVDDETTLDHLAGFADSTPVRLGNRAVSQLQLDIYGAVFDAVYLANKYVRGISHDGWNRMRQVLDWLEGNWNRPDEGIWEVRNGRQHFLHSRLMCWVTFDRAIRLAEKRSLVAPLLRWHQTRDAIHEDIFKNFWNEELGSFVQSAGSDRLDASTLLMPLLRFIAPSDPRWVSTMKRIEQKLTEDVLVYRYGSGVDGLDGEEGSFTACGFWRIECLARMGEVDKARLLFEKMLGYANHLGLYSEQLGRTGEQLGNFPQVLTHLALISAATYLDRKLTGGDTTWE